MKKSKFEKLVNEMIDAQKTFMDNCNEIIQSGVIKDEYTKRDFGFWYENANTNLVTLEDLKKRIVARDLHIENVFGISGQIELELDEDEKSND